MPILNISVFAFALLLVTPSFAFAEEFKPATSMSQLDFLVGHWFSDPNGAQNRGTFTFLKELGGTILVRRDHTEYAASTGHAAAPHDILMIVYEDREQGLQAIYFDNEGNNAAFRVLLASDGKAVQFISEASSEHPGLRLSYTVQPSETLGIKFEMEPPGSSNAFATVAQGLAHH